MLTPKKKITKKDLKQDTLVSTYARLTAWYYENKKYVGYVSFAIAIIVIAGYAYWRNQQDNNEKASTALGKIMAIYDAAASDPRQYKIAIDGQPERGVMGLKSIVENYGGTDAGELARFYLANAYYYSGQLDFAIQEFDDFNCDDNLLQASAYAGLAAAYESKGIFDKAAAAYEKAASTAGTSNQVPEYLVGAGRCYGYAGNKEKALTVLKRVKKEFPTSTIAREVDRYISHFSV